MLNLFIDKSKGNKCADESSGMSVFCDHCLRYSAYNQDCNPDATKSGFIVSQDYPICCDDGEALTKNGGHLDEPQPVECVFIPDWNRDGKIYKKFENSEDDRNQSNQDNPWRWWINNDNDKGDTEGDDIPNKRGNFEKKNFKDKWQT